MPGAGLTTIMPRNAQQIISPLSAFNNFIIDISREINSVFYPNANKKENQMLENNQIMFEDSSILLFGFLKIAHKKQEIIFQFSGGLDNEKIEVVHIFIDNKPKIVSIFQRYLFIVSEISQNYDDSISKKYISTIFEKIKTSNNPTELFLVPYKNKINHCYDQKDKTLEKLYNRFSYVISFINNKNKFNYKLMRVLSSDLDENKSLENIRFLEKETIKTDNVNMCDLNKFLINLYFYGEL